MNSRTALAFLELTEALSTPVPGPHPALRRSFAKGLAIALGTALVTMALVFGLVRGAEAVNDASAHHSHRDSQWGSKVAFRDSQWGS